MGFREELQVQVMLIRDQAAMGDGISREGIENERKRHLRDLDSVSDSSFCRLHQEFLILKVQVKLKNHELHETSECKLKSGYSLRWGTSTHHFRSNHETLAHSYLSCFDHHHSPHPHLRHHDPVFPPRNFFPSYDLKDLEKLLRDSVDS